MDGLKETLSNKLAPAFNAVSDMGIQAISSITDALDGIDGDAIAGKIKDLVATVKPYWTIIKTDVGIVKDAFEEAFSAIGKALGKLNGSFGSDENVSGFSKTLGTVTQAVTKFAGFLEEHADTIAKVIKAVTDHLPQLLGAFLALKGAQKAASGVKAVSGVFRAMASGPLESLAGKLFGVSKGTKKAGKSSRRSAKNLMASAKSFVLMGVGILAISAGFALLAKSAIELAKAGACGHRDYGGARRGRCRVKRRNDRHGEIADKGVPKEAGGGQQDHVVCCWGGGRDRIVACRSRTCSHTSCVTWYHCGGPAYRLWRRGSWSNGSIRKYGHKAAIQRCGHRSFCGSGVRHGAGYDATGQHGHGGRDCDGGLWACSCWPCSDVCSFWTRVERGDPGDARPCRGCGWCWRGDAFGNTVY
ncbi:MAG: hypothetical protein ACLVHV_17080 [Oscillospiraceae bacterium]